MSSKKHKRNHQGQSQGDIARMASQEPRKPKKVKAARPQSASLPRRFFAYLIDWYLGALCTMVPISCIAQWQTGEMTNLNLLEIPAPWGLIAGLIGVILAAAYYVLFPMLVWRGQTPGKRLCQVAIADASGSEVSTRQLLVRQIIGLIIVDGTLVSASSVWHQMLTVVTHVNFVTPLMYAGFAVCIVSVLMIIFQRDHRCIHDFLAGTEVVARPKEQQAAPASQGASLFD